MDDIKLSGSQLDTINSFKKIDKHLYLCNYQNNYFLDELLKEGSNNLKELVSFLSGKMDLPKKYLNAKMPSFGCTSFNGVTPGGDYILARNFDFKDGPTLLLWTAPENGYKSIGLVDMNFLLYGYKHQNPDRLKTRLKLLIAPYCCTDGINEEGLSVAVLELKTKATSQSNGNVPLPTTAVVRAVLDSCSTVDEAIEKFRKFDMKDSLFCCYHYQIIDRSGRSVVIEYLNNEMKIIEEPVVPGGIVTLQALTNFFISEGGDNAKAMGYDRFDIVKNDLLETKGLYTEKEAMGVLKRCNLDYPRFCYQVTTLWSAVYNASKALVDICAGMDYEHQYRFDVTKPMAYELV